MTFQYLVGQKLALVSFYLAWLTRIALNGQWLHIPVQRLSIRKMLEAAVFWTKLRWHMS